jgi:hypothetical protein
MITVGDNGFLGARVKTLVAGEFALVRHIALVSVQNARSFPAISVTSSPIERYLSSSEVAEMIPNVALTDVEFVQVHCVESALKNLKRMLQNQLCEVMFARSVGVLKLNMTACPLSEN